MGHPDRFQVSYSDPTIAVCRDLIDSADKIVSIANNCGLILQNVKSIQSGFSGLAHSFASADSLLNEKRDSLTRHEELYGKDQRCF
jgi:hypothetical protein